MNLDSRCMRKVFNIVAAGDKPYRESGREGGSVAGNAKLGQPDSILY